MQESGIRKNRGLEQFGCRVVMPRVNVSAILRPRGHDVRRRGILGPLPFAGAFILILFSSTACFRAETPLADGFASGRFRTLVAFGDSIVAGYGQPRGWPEMLQEDLAQRYRDIRIINAGVSGDTAGDGLRRLGRDVLARRPDLVLVSFGLNDMKNALPVQQFLSDLAAVVDGISGSGAQVVLMTTTRLQRGTGVLARANPAPYNQAIRSLARERGVPLLDVWEGFEGLNIPEYLMDAAHPNADGYRELTRIILEGLMGG